LLSEGQALDIAYFQHAYSVMNALVARPATYFVISDDYEYAETSFEFLPDRVIVQGDPDRAWEDLVLMSQCRHHIMANSSFSWWGLGSTAVPINASLVPADGPPSTIRSISILRGLF